MTEITSKLSTALADRYRIERHLGEGGMATVYLAKDLKHDRKVAVKVLRPELAAVLGAERFVQEIKTTANLQHPHILPLFDSGEADGFLYYVMPYIEGETLRDKLNRETQLGIDEAVSITTAIADALDYAHRQNVIHRDIKPENILLHEGRPMVADFGIALAVSAAAGGRMTETGLSLGTPHYMSPEQATAEKDLTNRSDIYSLGSMLYEMLTGEPPHTGGSAQAIIMKIVTEPADPVTKIRKSVQPHVAAATAKSLEKLAADRFESAAKFAEALTNPAFTLPTTQAAVAGAPASRLWNRLSVTTTALAAVFLVTTLWGWLRPDATPLLSRFAVVVPEGESLVADHDGTTLAFSPDGQRFIYTGPDRALYVRELGQLHASPLPGTEGARAPFFSPDGEWVGFFADSRLKKVALSGGPPLTIVETGADFRGAVWTEKDLIIFAHNSRSPLYRVSAAGGDTAAVTMLDPAAGEVSHRWPEILPGGVGIVFTVYGDNASEAHLAAVSLESGETKRFPILGMRPQYASTGHVVYGTADGSLLAVPFDAAGLELTGAPVSLLEGVMVRTSIASDFTLSRSGSLAYLSGLPPELSLVMVDRYGVEEETLVEELQQAEGPRVSPDGLRVALTRQESGNTDIWVYDLVERTLTRMTFEGNNRYPFWSLDGTRIGFSSAREGGERDLYWLPADGSGVAELFYATKGAQEWEASWMPDGQSLIVRRSDQGTRNIYAVPLAGGEEPRPLMQTEFNERSPMVSPKGGWFAYVSDESGRDEVYVRPLPGPGGKRQISTDGGAEPLWSLDGTELLYRGNDGNLYAVAIRTTPALSVGQRTVLFEDQHIRNTQHTNYDLNPRDGRFVMIKGSGEPTNLVVVLNWYEELRARTGN